MADLPKRESGDESLVRTTELGPIDRGNEDAIDFSLVHADDAFLDALGSAEPARSASFADDKLAELLLSWRQDVDSEPISNLVEPKLAVATVRAARARQRRGVRLVPILAAAAAVLAIAFAGAGLAARDAQPGDTLWALTQVLYSEHARSVEAAHAVRADLSKAQEALASGKVAEAKSMLDEARQTLPTVSSEDGRDDLQEQHAALEARLSGNPAVGVSPPPAASPTTAPVTGTSAPSTSAPADTTTSNPPTSDPTSTTPPTSTTDSGNGPKHETGTTATRAEPPASAPAQAPAADNSAAENPTGTTP